LAGLYEHKAASGSRHFKLVIGTSGRAGIVVNFELEVNLRIQASSTVYLIKMDESFTHHIPFFACPL
jgi:hypothetical protein